LTAATWVQLICELQRDRRRAKTALHFAEIPFALQARIPRRRVVCIRLVQVMIVVP